jgi:hypothetical protein
MTQPQAEMFDLYRAGLKTAADLVKTSLENAERLQNQQLAAIRSAIDQQAKSASELSRVKSMDELLSLQGRMAGVQFERAMTLWSELVQAAGESQRTWLAEAAKLAAGATSNVRQSAKAQERPTA